MSSRAQIQSLGARPATLEQVAGEGVGQFHELVTEKLTLGRAPDNDIVLANEGVSRLHAMMIFSDGAWFIRDNQSKNGIIINGKNVRESWLENGDIIQIGASAFRFHSAVEPEAPLAPAPAVEDPLAGDFGPAAEPAKAGVNRRVYIYGGAALLLAGLWFLTSGDGAKKEPGSETAGGDAVADSAAKLARDFKTAEEPNLNIDKKDGKLVGVEDPILKKAEQDMLTLDWTNASLRESEQFFRRGQREYLNHSYSRAIESFQTALSLYRGHVLAERYLRRTVYEVEIEAKKNMQIGVQYFEALQYQRAMFHFSEAIALMAHRPTEPIVTEADRYIQQCKKRLQAAEFFP